MDACHGLKSLDRKAAPFRVFGVGQIGQGDPPSEAFVVVVLCGQIQVQHAGETKGEIAIRGGRGFAIIGSADHAVPLADVGRIRHHPETVDQLVSGRGVPSDVGQVPCLVLVSWPVVVDVETTGKGPQFAQVKFSLSTDGAHRDGVVHHIEGIKRTCFIIKRGPEQDKVFVLRRAEEAVESKHLGDGAANTTGERQPFVGASKAW